MPLFKKRAGRKSQSNAADQYVTSGNGASTYDTPSGSRVGAAGGMGSPGMPLSSPRSPGGGRGYVGSHVTLDPATSMAPVMEAGPSRVRNGHATVASANDMHHHGSHSPRQEQHTMRWPGSTSSKIAPSNGAAAQIDNAVDDMAESKRPIKYRRHLSKKKFDIGGLPVAVYGLEELTPAAARASAPAPPDVCIAIHMHGRGGSADNEEHIVRHLWDSVQRNGQQGHGQSARELVFVGFDSRNHGHRKTSALAQKGWKQDNPTHGVDLYAMLVGTARDVSFLVDFLPSYLFPQDERRVSQWAVTGKSLGGHAAWHVLANDPRITVGVPFISCPSYARLMERRTKTAFVANGPPYIPRSLADLVSRIDPASQPFDLDDPRSNPFHGKRICMLNGGADKIVPFRCGEDFAQRLRVGGPCDPASGAQQHLRVHVRNTLGHEVNEEMVEEAGQWLYYHAVLIS